MYVDRYIFFAMLHTSVHERPQNNHAYGSEVTNKCEPIGESTDTESRMRITFTILFGRKAVCSCVQKAKD